MPNNHKNTSKEQVILQSLLQVSCVLFKVNITDKTAHNEQI